MSDTRIMIPPPGEPISLTEAKSQLRVDLDHTFDDDLIRACIAAARTQVEDLTRRQIVMATYRVTFDAFPGSLGGRGDWGYLGGGIAGAAMAPKAWPNAKIDDAAIQLFGGPLQTVNSITYLDTTGATQTLASTEYVVDAENDPARIMPKVGGTFNGWPDTQGSAINTVQVNAAAGWMIPFTANSSNGYITLAAGAKALETGQAIQVTAVDLSDVDGSLPTILKRRQNYYAVNVSGLTCQLALTPGGAAVTINNSTGVLMIDTCPEAIRQALRLLVTHFYEQRGEKDAPMPSAVTSLLIPWKVWRF